MLVLAWKLDAQSMGYFTLQEWLKGMGSLQYVWLNVELVYIYYHVTTLLPFPNFTFPLLLSYAGVTLLKNSGTL